MKRYSTNLIVYTLLGSMVSGFLLYYLIHDAIKIFQLTTEFGVTRDLIAQIVFDGVLLWIFSISLIYTRQMITELFD